MRWEAVADTLRPKASSWRVCCYTLENDMVEILEVKDMYGK
jgi:hypothetical protein